MAQIKEVATDYTYSPEKIKKAENEAINRPKIS
jgi:hypothetical protein